MGVWCRRPLRRLHQASPDSDDCVRRGDCIGVFCITCGFSSRLWPHFIRTLDIGFATPFCTSCFETLAGWKESAAICRSLAWNTMGSQTNVIVLPQMAWLLIVSIPAKIYVVKSIGNPHSHAAYNYVRSSLLLIHTG